MVHPNTILYIPPPSALDEIIEKTSFESLHIYVDLKNVATSLFVDVVAQEIVHNSNTGEGIDSSIFQSILSFSIFWKRWALQHNLDLKIFFCCDKGSSTYHLNIDENYKATRIIGRVDLPSYYEELTEIRRKNTELAEQVCNRLPNVYFFLLKFLESDFLPYFLITRYYPDPKFLNIIISNDRDMFQIIRGSNTFMLYKIRGTTFILDEKSVLSKLVGLNKASQKTKERRIRDIQGFDLDFLPALMAITGDSGDEVPGVQGIGPVRALEMLSFGKAEEVLGSFKDLIERVVVDHELFIPEEKIESISKISKLWKDVSENNEVVTRALKLTSFEALSTWLEIGATLHQGEQTKYIHDIVNCEKFPIISSSAVFAKSMEKSIWDLNLDTKDLEVLHMESF